MFNIKQLNCFNQLFSQMRTENYAFSNGFSVIQQNVFLD